MLEASPQRVRLHNNISRLLEITATTRERLVDRAIYWEYRQFEPSDEIFQAPMEHLELQGRPRLIVNESDVSGLRSLGFSWVDISNIIGVSLSTLRRRRPQFETLPDFSYSNISDNELDNMVRGILQTTPQAGRNLVRGTLLSQGVQVQRRRIVASIERVDPVTATLRDRRTIIRRVYSVPCPNFLWYVLM